MVWLIAVVMLLIAFTLLFSLLITFFTGAIWSPTPMRTVRRMLALAGVKPGEKVYDPGSGDGRIALVAGKEFRAKAVGMEINPFLVLVARLKIAAAGIGDSVRIRWKNLYGQSLRDADVVAVYLSARGNERLRKKLERELKPGARVVSHRWPFRGWKAAKVDEGYIRFTYTKLGPSDEYSRYLFLNK